MSPGSPFIFILESKGQRPRSRVKKNIGSLHSCECWLLLIDLLQFPFIAVCDNLLT